MFELWYEAMELSSYNITIFFFGCSFSLFILAIVMVIIYGISLWVPFEFGDKKLSLRVLGLGCRGDKMGLLSHATTTATNVFFMFGCYLGKWVSEVLLLQTFYLVGFGPDLIWIMTERLKRIEGSFYKNIRIVHFDFELC